MKNLFQFKNPAAFQASIVTFFLALFLLLVIFSIKSFAQATFSPATDFAGTFGSYMSTIADINGDGKQDMVVAGFGGTITVFLNTTTPGASTPTFSVKTDFTAGGTIYNAVSADFNGDGKQDIAFIVNSPNSVSIYTNTTTTGAATPTFSSVTSIAAPANGPINIAVGDINGDGKPDLVIDYFGYAFVTVYLNTTTTGAATPTFSAGTDLPITSSGRSVALKDLNGDGKLDIAAVCETAATVSVYLNTTITGAATPTFSAKTDFAVTTGPYSIQIADVNLDGKQDLVVLQHSNSRVAILLNTTTTGSSTPTFSALTSFAAGNNINILNVGDLNNDGKPDMIISPSDPNLNKIGVLLNNTTPGAVTPAFYPMTEFATTGQPQQCSIADFNGDGKPDLAATTVTYNISVLMNTMTLGSASVTFSAHTDFTTPINPWYGAVADFNLDGKPDFTVACDAPNLVSVLLNTTTPGASTPTFAAKTDLTGGTNGEFSICTADFNLDGKPDIACAGNNPGTISVFFNTTTPGSLTATFGTRVDLNVGTAYYGSLTGCDINGDGKPDLISCGGNNVGIYMNTTTPGSGTPSFSAKVDFTAGSSPQGMVVVDLNGDGKPDIATSNSGANTISVLFNTTTPGASTPTFTAKTDFTVASAPAGLCAADINGDGKLDLISTSGSSNFISVILNTTTAGSSTPSFSAKTDFATPLPGFKIVAGDFNADGKPDVVQQSFGGGGVVYLFLNTTTTGGSTPILTRTDVPNGNNLSSICAADFNLDGILDIGTSINGTAKLGIILNQTNIPAPVELSSFTSSVDKQNVTLSWSTIQEENNRGFEIEGNSFGAGWRTVGFTEGHGTSNQINNYSYTECGMATGHYNYRLKQIDYNGNYKYYDLSNEVIIGIPQKYSLSQNYPNPFNPVSVIGYQLPASGYVSLKVFDISGREVSNLVNEVKEAGYYSVTFDAKGLSSGTYFYKINTDKFSDVKKMVVVK